MRRSLLLVPVLLVLVVLALSARGVRARGTLDQSFVPMPAGSDFVIVGFAPGVIGQTFTAGISGLLDTVALDLSAVTESSTGPSAAIPSTSVTVGIYATAAGLPNPSALLATATAAVTRTTTPTDPSQFTVVTFGAPATVSAGQLYAIVISNPQPSFASVHWWFSGASTYPRGQAVISPGGLAGPYTPVGDNISFDFQTFVTQPATPTPSAVSSFVGVPSLPTLTVIIKGCGRTDTPSGTQFPNQIGNLMVMAIPCAGSTFTGWTSGPCAGTTINPCDVGPATSTISATFAP